MTATPPSLTTPPPPPSFFPAHTDNDIFTIPPPTTMPNGLPLPNGGFGVDGAIPDHPPPPAPAANANDAVSQQPPTDGSLQPNSNSEHNEDGSDSEGDDSEDEERQPNGAESWYPIIEEKREYVEDELRYFSESKEHSAHDHKYWEKKVFKDLGDPEITPGPKGSIDFAIDHFNGTKEKPNTETIMRSEVKNIGGYDWRLKLYPRGNNTDHLSVYIENVTMQAPEWEGTEEYKNPPLPFLASHPERPRKRRCVAAQVCLVLYNPTEPRQYEYRDDAHQFSKDIPDYGWTRFSHMRRRDLGLRNHFQRAPILQDDKLAFRAYIRVIDDPTGCLWNHGSRRFSSDVAATGLRPFSRILPILSADLVLLHFPPFRDLVYKWQQEQDCSKFVSWMNILLWKMLSRERSELYGEPIECEQSDSVAWFRRAVKLLKEESGAETSQELFGSWDTAQTAVGGGRLKTKAHSSVQGAIDAHETALETPALLTLELERQHFDRETRRWQRITNKVSVENEIKVQGRQYKLFAFITHHGELASNAFRTYVRPRGPGTMWYGYSDDKVTCMTHKQALDGRCGRDDVVSDQHSRSLFPLGRDRRGRHSFVDEFEVAHVLFYVREDYAIATFEQPEIVEWDPPKYVKHDPEPEETKSVQNEPAVPVVEEKEIAPDDTTKRSSISSMGSEYIAGCATPTHWFTDEDGDVVMSETEEENSEKPTETEGATKVDDENVELEHCTIDNLGCSYYSGQMLGSSYHGQGHLITLNGDEYTGTFSHGLKSGAGTMIYATNGDTYTGDWLDDKRHGGGKYIEKSTGNVFDGTWKHDLRSGQFTLTGTVTDEDKGICSICYEREMNTAFYDCGHVVACAGCAERIEDCPVCRRRIVSRLQLFGVKVRLE